MRGYAHEELIPHTLALGHRITDAQRLDYRYNLPKSFYLRQILSEDFRNQHSLRDSYELAPRSAQRVSYALERPGKAYLFVSVTIVHKCASFSFDRYVNPGFTRQYMTLTDKHCSLIDSSKL
jgi:hypothetical protein